MRQGDLRGAHEEMNRSAGPTERTKAQAGSSGAGSRFVEPTPGHKKGRPICRYSGDAEPEQPSARRTGHIEQAR